MAIAGAMALLGASVNVARAGDFHLTSVNVASGLASVSNTTATSTSGTAFSIPPETDIAIQPIFTAADSGKSNVWHQFNLTGDGTNFSTVLPISVTNAANGTNPVSGWTVITKAQLHGAKSARLDAVGTTQTNAVTTTGVNVIFFY